MGISRSAEDQSAHLMRKVKYDLQSLCAMGAVSQNEVLGRFYNPNTTPEDKERVVVCLCGTGQELH